MFIFVLGDSFTCCDSGVVGEAKNDEGDGRDEQHDGRRKQSVEPVLEAGRHGGEKRFGKSGLTIGGSFVPGCQYRGKSFAKIRPTNAQSRR